MHADIVEPLESDEEARYGRVGDSINSWLTMALLEIME